MSGLGELAASVHACRRCPRLLDWCQCVAQVRRAAFRDETYWGRPVAGFGDQAARLMLVGLAPAAHGANRTGRVFTGDRSGDFLFEALYRAGLANQPVSRSRDDGLRLNFTYVTAIVRCAPPANRPTATERSACRPWLEAELDLLPDLRVVVALGGEAWRQMMHVYRDRGDYCGRRISVFGHGEEISAGVHTMIGSYHPSQQNTFTGRLTPDMLDAVLTRACEIACIKLRE